MVLPDSVAEIYAGRRITRWCESCRRLFEVEFPQSQTLGDLLFGTPHARFRARVDCSRSGGCIMERGGRAGSLRGDASDRLTVVSATHERQTAEALTLAVFHVHPLGTSLTVVAVSREDVLYAESIRLTPADRF